MPAFAPQAGVRKALALALLAARSLTVAGQTDQGSTFDGALASDDQCGARAVGQDQGGDVECALGALQLRGRRLEGEGIFGHPSADAEYPVYEDMTLMLVEEFDSPLDLDSDPIWTWSDGGLAEGQVRFTKENIKFHDGKMVIEMSAEPAQHAQPCSHAEVGAIGSKSKSSGELRTRHNMFRYGLYEVKMKAPSVQPSDTETNGNFVSAMFVFRDAKFKHWREIDVEITGDSPNEVRTNVLFAEDAREYHWPGMDDSGVHDLVFNARSDFHTYGFLWLPDRITWYVDGAVVREKTLDGESDLPVPELSGKIMMSLWMFNETVLFGGREIQNDRFPMYAEYDWFRFYKWNGDLEYPCPEMDGACLTEDDRYLSGNNPCDGIPNVGTIFGEEPCHATCA